MCFVFVSAHDAGKFFSLLEFVPTFWSRAVYYSQGQSGHSSSWYVQKSSLLFVKTDQNILFPMNCIAPDTIWIPIFTRLSQRFVWCWKQVDKYTCKVMACFFNSFIIHAFNAQSTVHQVKSKSQIFSCVKQHFISSYWKRAGERMNLEGRNQKSLKGIIPYRRNSMQRYILTYSRFIKTWCLVLAALVSLQRWP